MRDRECVDLLRWALPRLRLRWLGFRRVRGQVCKRISRRIAELGLADARAYRARLESDPDEWAVLDACCWISVSRFCRDRGVYAHLAREILPELARLARAEQRTAMRTWSAGCASGEEPYSLKLAWELVAGTDFPEIGLAILATDVNPKLLERALRAVYGGGAMKELPSAWREGAFQERGGEYRLRQEMRAGVELRREDIREQMPPGPFDLILCRNLAFTYFDDVLQRAVLQRLLERLTQGGVLVVGAHESLSPWPELARASDCTGFYRRAV